MVDAIYLRLLLWCFSGLWVCMFGLQTALMGETIGLRTMLNSAGGAISATLCVVWLFQKYAWKWTWVRTLLPDIPPDLTGTWHGKIDSEYEDRRIEAYTTIRQTFNSVVLRQFTRKSGSKSHVAVISKSDDGEFTLYAAYTNEGFVRGDDLNPRHEGALRVRVLGDPPTGLSGKYWTDRKTRGDLYFDSHVNNRSSSFDEARGLFTAV